MSHENDTSVYPTVIEEAQKGIKVAMSIMNPQARMMEFVNELFERLESAGYEISRKRTQIRRSRLYSRMSLPLI